jgi:hypothetical protein
MGAIGVGGGGNPVGENIDVEHNLVDRLQVIKDEGDHGGGGRMDSGELLLALRPGALLEGGNRGEGEIRAGYRVD